MNEDNTVYRRPVVINQQSQQVPPQQPPPLNSSQGIANFLSSPHAQQVASDIVNNLPVPSKEETENLVQAGVATLYTPCDESLIEFKYKICGHGFKYKGTLPPRFQSAPIWVLNGLRIYWLFYRADASWKHIGMGFCVGATMVFTVRPALEALKEKNIFDYEKILSPGLRHLVDLVALVLTLVFNTGLSNMAFGFQLGNQIASRFKA